MVCISLNVYELVYSLQARMKWILCLRTHCNENHFQIIAFFISLMAKQIQPESLPLNNYNKSDNMANDSVTLGGKPQQLRGTVLQPGIKAPEFTFVTEKLEEKSSYELGHKALVIIAVPSLDTGVCAKETRRFNELLSAKEGAIGLTMSMDLPFAMKRFCELEGIKNLIAGSDFRYREFGEAFNADIIDGAFKGLIARVVFVIDADNVVRYTELVPEIGQEPDYDKVLAAVDGIL
ncbi:hypothetical protein BH09BAC1_BH09BAC1_08360 [soil metagenome]